MDAKSNIIKNIFFHLNTYGEFILWDVDICNGVNENGEPCGEWFKASRVFINDSNEAMVELENGEEYQLEELDYNELLAIYEEIV